MDTVTWLNSRLAQLQPQKILYCAPATHPLPEPWKPRDNNLTILSNPDLSELSRKQSFDFALIDGQLEHLDIRSGQTFLGYLCNRFCNNVYVWLQKSASAQPWSVEHFYALGFSCLGALNRPATEGKDSELLVYGFQLHRYNPHRAWNTSKNWANPENFNKFRW